MGLSLEQQGAAVHTRGGSENQAVIPCREEINYCTNHANEPDEPNPTVGASSRSDPLLGEKEGGMTELWNSDVELITTVDSLSYEAGELQKKALQEEVKGIKDPFGGQ